MGRAESAIAYKARGYDLDFINRIKPAGGMQFKDSYIQTGNGYTQTLTVYAVPRDVPRFWLSDVIENKKTISTISIGTAKKEELLKVINRSMNEALDRADKERRQTDRNDAWIDHEELARFAQEITQGGETIKKVIIRIFVSADTLEELEKEVAAIRSRLEGLDYRLTTYLFCQDQEWESLFTPISVQLEELIKRDPVEIPSKALGGGNPFNHQYLNDERGIYLGTTATDGAFIFDPFATTKTRKSFSSFLLGKSGFGKSTFMKMLEEGLVGRHCIIRGFEKNGDWYNLIRKQNGKIVDLSGKGVKVNPLEVFATVTTDKTGLHIDEIGSYTIHRSKIINQIRFLYPELSSVNGLRLTKYIDEFYVYKGMLPKNYTEVPDKVKITGLDPKDYPLMEEFADYFKSVIFPRERKIASSSTKDALEDFSEVLNSMATTYGSIFNGYTTLKNFDDEQIVFYDIDTISQGDKNIFNCQLYTAMTLTWSQATKNGRKMKTLRKEKKIRDEDTRYFMFFLDECQNFLSEDVEFVIDDIVLFLKEMRKFSAGITFATQSPQAILPEAADSTYISKVKQVFELCQNKFFLNMDESVMGRMREIMGSGLTESDYQMIQTLELGDVLAMVGSENFPIHVDPTEAQIERFEGGH